MTWARVFDTPLHMLLALLFSVIAHTETLSTCSMSATLYGDARHYKFYGRDSWSGNATLHCQPELKREVRVTFNSFQGGFGADAQSELKLTLFFTTTSDPATLLLNRQVSNRSGAESVRWHFSTETTSGAASITRVTERELSESLSFGRLYLRDKPQ